MAEKHHHSPFHHGHADQPTVPVTDTTDVYVAQDVGDGRTEIKHAKHKERLGELGAAGAAVFALHEKHEGKKDPERAKQHRLEEELAAVAGVGAGGYAFHEHHNKDAAKDAGKAAEGKKHHF